MLKTLIIFSLLTLVSLAKVQGQKTIMIIDFVKVKNDKKQETLFYYQNNWKQYRDAMLEKGFIKSYHLIETKPDTVGIFDLILMTEYQDSTAYQKSEARFQEIIKQINPNEAKLLNEIKPFDFRKNVFVKFGETVFSSDKKKKKGNGKQHF